MRLCRVKVGGLEGIATADGSGLRAILKDEPGYPGDLDELIAGGLDSLAAAQRSLAGAKMIDPADVRFKPVIDNPGKIICVGLNYRDHTVEAKMVQPEFPVIFSRFADNLIGHLDAIQMPRVSSQLDYEGELVVIIGKPGKYISRETALRHVAGYSIFNDVSVRDYQMRSHQWTLGKNFDATGAFGPYFVSADELPTGGAGLKIETRLNGHVVQSASTADMIHGVAELISVVSEAFTLRAGDIIVSGTPSGVGFARKPPLFMKVGDSVTVEIEGVGRLTNPIAAESLGS